MKQFKNKSTSASPGSISTSTKKSDNNLSLWHSASGPIAIPLTNDYLFRALLQQNNHVLKGLICALLNLPEKDVRSVVINNPIVLGESINEKTFFLDVALTLNNNALINPEMQVINEHNWPERSLSYLCRTFNTLNSGENYHAVKPTIQIGLLDFTLFPEHPEFYATYKFMNVKNHTIYSDKLRLSVLDLTCIHLATEEDKHCRLDHWASLFKSTTWEELKMLAQKNEFINEASATIYQLSQEETVRLQCEAREDYYRRQRSVQSMIAEQKEQLAEYENTIHEYKNTIHEYKDTIQKQADTISELKETITNQEKQLTSQEQQLTSQKQQLASQEQQLTAQEQQLSSLLTWANENGYQK